MGKRAFRAASVMAMALSMAACANTVRGGPARIHNVIANETTKYGELNAAIANACFKPKSGSFDQSKRDNVIYGYMLLADRRYNKFESDLLNENRGGNFLASTLSLGITSAGTLASESAAQTLTAVDTGLKGATQSFGKEFLFSQTIPALINQMRASRSEARTEIIEGLNGKRGPWPLCAAMRSLAKYEQSGTLTSAIANLTQNAADDKKASEAEEEQTIKESFTRGELQSVLSRYADPGLPDAILSKRLRLLTLAMQNANVGQTAGDLLRLHASNSGDIEKVIVEAQKLESDSDALRILVVPEGN